MNDVVLVAKRHAFDDLVDEEPESLWIDSDSVVLQDLQQIFLDVLEDQVESSLAFESFLKHDDILVLEQPQHFDFSHDGLLGDFVIL